MKKVYSAPLGPAAHIAKELLEDNGIEAVVQAESLPILAGSVPWTDTWPSVWVEDSDEAAAKTLLKDFGQESAKEETENWTCPVCGEKSNPKFGGCWKCAAASQPEAPPPDSLAQNKARLGLVGALALTVVASIFLSLCDRKKLIYPHFPFVMFGNVIIATCIVLSLYFIGKVFETGADYSPAKISPKMLWHRDAFLSAFKILLLVWLAMDVLSIVLLSCKELFHFLNFPRWLISLFLVSLLILQTIGGIICYCFIIRIIWKNKKATSAANGKPTC
jgi:hypothetical protein